MMKVKIATAVIALFMFVCAAGLASAQDTTKKTTHKKTRTVTGCLQKGEDAHEYRLTAKGSTWEIESDSIKLDEHVGHTVTVTGVVSNAKLHGMKEDAKQEMKEHGMSERHAKERGHLAVTGVTMVSDTCQK